MLVFVNDKRDRPNIWGNTVCLLIQRDERAMTPRGNDALLLAIACFLLYTVHLILKEPTQEQL
jgi:hypothetical protein